MSVREKVKVQIDEIEKTLYGMEDSQEGYLDS